MNEVLVPDDLAERNQWVMWRYETRDEKRTKVPYRVDGHKASPTNTEDWSDYRTVVRTLEGRPREFNGIGFVFGPDDPFAGVDFDNCLEDGEVKQWAQPIIERFSDTYMEISPSGKGIKIFAKAGLPGRGKRKEYGDHAIEIYDRGRFFAVTGQAFNGAPLQIEDHQADIEALYKSLERPSKNGNGSAITQGKIPKGRRHNFLVSLAGTMHRRGMSEEAIDAALWAENCARCEPPHDRQHVRKIAESAQGWEGIARDRREPISDELLWSYPHTDIGNAERLVCRHGDDIRFCHPWKKWLVWDGQRFQIDATAEILRRAKDTTRRMFSAAVLLTDTDRRDKSLRHARETEKHARIRAMMDLAAAEDGIPVLPEQLDSDPWLLNVLNGTLDLRKKVADAPHAHGCLLREHRQEDLITKLCPVQYDAQAQCPTWIAFQRRVTNGNEELMRFKQRAFGYALTGAVTEKRSLFILFGAGNNGKTTELEVLRDLLGDYAGQIRIESLTEQRRQNGNAPSPDIADLRGLRFVISSEPAKGQQLAENTIKYLTGMGTIKARQLHCGNFGFKQSWKLFLDCNPKPVIRGDDAAIWNRIGLIPFEVVIPDEEIDPDLPAKLRSELRGILAWAVEGCLDWQAQGLNAPASVQSATADYRREMDVIARFVEECCVIGDWSSARAKMLYERYHKWCLETGENAETMMTFGVLITQREGVTKTHDRKGVKYEGIGLREDPRDDPL